MQSSISINLIKLSYYKKFVRGELYRCKAFPIQIPVILECNYYLLITPSGPNLSKLIFQI